MRYVFRGAGIGVVLAFLCGFSQAAPNVVIPLFHGPKLRRFSLFYEPGDDASRHEGWTKFSFMVSPTGKAFDIAVIDSSGDPDLSTVARQELQAARFKPATLGGKPIESSSELIVFSNNPRITEGASSRFSKIYGRFLSAMRNKNRVAATGALDELRPIILNLYEDAHYALALYSYASVWGNAADQLADLNRALSDRRGGRPVFSFEQPVSFFSPEQLRGIDFDRLRLQLQLHEYAEALDTWDELQKMHLDAATVARIAPIIANVRALRTHAASYTVEGTIGNQDWFLHLFEPQFRIVVKEGRIFEVRLRCERGYVYFPFNPDLEYTVHGKYGKCTMDLAGTRGTQFTLYQF